jgi:hypothetical protein
MTVADDRPAAIRGLTFLTLLVVGVLLAGCAAADRASAQTSSTPSAGTQAPIPGADEQAIHATIDRLNAAAGGTVADQQSVLMAEVDPTLIDALDKCSPATTTLRFEPIYQGLRAAPGWSPSVGELSGTVYALPSLIRIYTGDRITGTDLTTLHLGVRPGEAYLTALCVG